MGTPKSIEEYEQRDTTRFTFVCSEYERQIIDRLANKLQRSRSNTVRWAIIKLAESEGIDINNGRLTLTYSKQN